MTAATNLNRIKLSEASYTAERIQYWNEYVAAPALLRSDAALLSPTTSGTSRLDFWMGAGSPLSMTRSHRATRINS